MPSHIPTADHHDIALSQCRALPLQRGDDFIHWDFVPRDRARCFSLLLFIPRQPIAQHTSTHNTSPLAPIVGAVRVRLSRLLMCETVVVLPACLVRKVLQAIPLGSGLCVLIYD